MVVCFPRGTAPFPSTIMLPALVKVKYSGVSGKSDPLNEKNWFMFLWYLNQLKANQRELGKRDKGNYVLWYFLELFDFRTTSRNIVSRVLLMKFLVRPPHATRPKQAISIVKFLLCVMLFLLICLPQVPQSFLFSLPILAVFYTITVTITCPYIRQILDIIWIPSNTVCSRKKGFGWDFLCKREQCENWCVNFDSHDTVRLQCAPCAMFSSLLTCRIN